MELNIVLNLKELLNHKLFSIWGRIEVNTN